MITIAFEDQRHFIGILALKSDGVIDQDCEIEILDRIVAQKLWLDFATIKDVKKRLINAGLINQDWQPLAWDKRQFKSDNDKTGAERQRRWRDKQKNQQEQKDNQSVPLRNGTVTQPDTDTDTETETETEETTAPPIKTTETIKAATRVANHLYQKLIREIPEAKTLKPRTWVKDIDRAIRIDGRTESELMAVIDWMHTGDKFWVPNVQSGKKLRSQYVTMVGQMRRLKVNGAKRPSNDFKNTDYRAGTEGFETNA